MSLRTDGGDVDGGERSRARPVFPLSNDDTDSLCKVLFFATQLEGSCNKENTQSFLKVSYFFHFRYLFSQPSSHLEMLNVFIVGENGSACGLRMLRTRRR